MFNINLLDINIFVYNELKLYFFSIFLEVCFVFYIYVFWNYYCLWGLMFVDFMGKILFINLDFYECIYKYLFNILILKLL